MKREARLPTEGDTSQPSDQELVAACLKGDPVAWETLIVRYQRLIYSIPIRMGLYADDAADVFQSICLKIFEKLATLREREKLSSWIITSTTRECWRVSASRRREDPTARKSERDTGPAGEVAAPGALPLEQQLVMEQQQAVRQAVAALPERCRQLITMLFYRKEDLKYSQIARRMNMPASSVGPTRARCLEKLKKLLEGKI